MKSKAKFKRRILVVEKELQSRIVRDMGSLPMIVLAVGTLLVALTTRFVLQEAEAASAELPSILPLFFSVFGFVVLASVSILSQGLRVSHRVAGPQYRIRQVVDEALAGDSEARAKLRVGDYLHDTAEDVNRLLARIAELESKSAPGSETQDSSDRAATEDRELVSSPSE